MLNFIQNILKPKFCFRRFYTMEKFDTKCKCIIKCKYPPPPNPIPIVQYNDVPKTIRKF